jgi:hypothetical protein
MKFNGNIHKTKTDAAFPNCMHNRHLLFAYYAMLRSFYV